VYDRLSPHVGEVLLANPVALRRRLGAPYGPGRRRPAGEDAGDGHIANRLGAPATGARASAAVAVPRAALGPGDALSQPDPGGPAALYSASSTGCRSEAPPRPRPAGADGGRRPGDR